MMSAAIVKMKHTNRSSMILRNISNCPVAVGSYLLISCKRLAGQASGASVALPVP